MAGTRKSFVGTAMAVITYEHVMCYKHALHRFIHTLYFCLADIKVHLCTFYRVLILNIHYTIEHRKLLV